jgi:hypothetical protein
MQKLKTGTNSYHDKTRLQEVQQDRPPITRGEKTKRSARYRNATTFKKLPKIAPKQKRKNKTKKDMRNQNTKD